MPRPKTVNLKGMSPEEFRAYNLAKQRLFYARRAAGIPVRRRLLAGEKKCRKCGEHKPFTVEHFNKRGDAYNYLKTICRTCEGLIAIANIRKNKYGLTAEQVAVLRVRPCVLCQSSKRLSFDHCHASGKFRNVLCQQCNHGLGNFKDRPDLLRLAAQYVEHYAKLHAGQT